MALRLPLRLPPPPSKGFLPANQATSVALRLRLRKGKVGKTLGSWTSISAAIPNFFSWGGGVELRLRLRLCKAKLGGGRSPPTIQPTK